MFTGLLSILVFATLVLITALVVQVIGSWVKAVAFVLALFVGHWVFVSITETITIQAVVTGIVLGLAAYGFYWGMKNHPDKNKPEEIKKPEEPAPFSPTLEG